MTVIRFSAPPDPPEGEQWCLICLMSAKEKIVEKYPNLLDLVKDGKNTEHWVSWDNAAKLFTAVCEGISDEPQLGRVPVCFSHLVFYKHETAPQLLQGQALPPGLIRGQG